MQSCVHKIKAGWPSWIDWVHLYKLKHLPDCDILYLKITLKKLLIDKKIISYKVEIQTPCTHKIISRSMR